MKRFICWLLGHQAGGSLQDKWVLVGSKYLDGWRHECPRCGRTEQNAEEGIEFRSLWKRHIGWRILSWKNKRHFGGSYNKKNNVWVSKPQVG